MLLQQIAAEFERILICLRRDFIHEVLGEECVLRMPDRAPEPERHRMVDQCMLNLDIGNFITWSAMPSALVLSGPMAGIPMRALIECITDPLALDECQ